MTTFTDFEDELSKVHAYIAQLKAHQLQAQTPLPPMTEQEIIKLGLDVIDKMSKYPFMMRFIVMAIISNGDEHTMRAVQKWLETVSPGKPNYL